MEAAVNVQHRVQSVTFLQAFILRALLKSGESHAYGVLRLVRELNASVQISDQINAPSVYKSLGNLAGEGLVMCRENAQGGDTYPARGQLYQITDEGRRVLVEYGIHLNQIRHLLDV